MPFASVNDINLYYEERGAGAALVWVHGFSCGIRSWDLQVQAFSSSRRVIAYDLRGFGISDAPDAAAAYSQDISVADLAGLLDHLRIERAALGGLSMGGNIALNYTLSHPERVCALIIADTGAGSDDTADWVAGSLRYADAAEHGGV